MKDGFLPMDIQETFGTMRFTGCDEENRDYRNNLTGCVYCLAADRQPGTNIYVEVEGTRRKNFDFGSIVEVKGLEGKPKAYRTASGYTRTDFEFRAKNIVLEEKQ